MLVTVMAKLKRQGYVPKNDIILAFTGDEETGQLTARALAEKYKDAALVLNSDAGGGGLDEDGVARFYFLQAAEKTYVDFKLEFTNPGGHSSAPRPDNAIYQLAAALSKVGAHNFTPVRSELTDASLGAVVDGVEPEIGAAIKAFLADPNDPSALAVLRANPEYVGQIATTCVSTMITAGHAPNALPQRATANINCRIFPGTSIEAVQAELLTVIGDPAASLTIDGDPHAAPASPLREDVFAAVTAAVNARYPGIPVIPDMSAGATDGAFYRSKGIPSYGVGGVFMKSSDIFAHGLNERSPVDAIPGAITQWESVIHALCD
jgi:acetylornithine deacetylase/succinyl-diaminopimelate desuccinylase-like protein